MTSTFRSFLLILFALLVPGPSSAQVQTGTPRFGSFGGGPDVINLANLNSHITVPVVRKAGRGIPFTYDLSYDSSVWYPVGVSGSQTWQYVNNWGWRGRTEVATGYITYSVSQTSCLVDPGPPRQTDIKTRYYNWIYHDSFGVPHNMNIQVYDDAGCLFQNDPYSQTSTAPDGSGYTMTADASPSATLTSAAGKIINAPLQSSAGAATATDRNGNKITVSTGGVFTDTLGTTALTVTGGAPNPLNFTYTAPSGAAASVRLNYTTYTVKTNFGCAGIAEYGPTSISLVSSISLPDGTSYAITYEATPGFPGDVTGRIQSLTLPTGGSITYTYTGPNNGIICADGSTAGLIRTLSDGAAWSATWTYARSQVSGSHWTTTITDPTTPTANQSVIHFWGLYETQRQVYQGSNTSGTVLLTRVTCYNGNTTNCTTTAVTEPITRKTITNQVPDASGKQSKSEIFYNAFGLVTEDDEYDYGAGSSVGSIVKKTLVTYATLGNGIVDRPATVTVQDGGGVTKAQTTYLYDEGTVTPTSGTPQHVSVTGSRGNPTTIKYLVQGTTTINRTFTYYDTGTQKTATDFNLAVTTFNYGTGSCGNSFVTSVSLPLTLSRSTVWNCTGGVATSTTDENQKTTTTNYTDPYFWRPNSMADQLSSTTTLSYGTNPMSVESALTFNGTASTVDLLLTFDGLGRAHVSQRKQAPGSGTYDSSEVDYDSTGLPSRATLPYSGTAGQTNPTAPATTRAFDTLGRPTQITDAGSGTVTLTYTKNDVYQTVGPAPAGENTKRRQLEYDALGRLTSVCEITSAASSGSCAQTTAQTGYWTKHTYDVLGNLAGVTQNAQAAPSQQQTRSYSYDGLGRMTSETNPESGTTNYVYDSDATCGTSKGDLVKRTDAVGNTTCFSYDALHRVTSTTYTGPYAASTPSKYFVYDAATINTSPTPTAMVNAKTRLAEAYTCISPCTSKITDVGFSYSARGEVTDVYQSAPHSGGYYHVTAAYWPHGALNQLSGLSGLPTLTYGVDSEGRSSSVSASSGQNPVSSTVYNLASQPTQVNLGSLDSDNFTYDPNTVRMTQYKFNVNGQSVIGNLTWNADGSLGTLSITNPFNSADTQNCAYAHDDLARLASANCGAVWSQTFGYDAFGNLTKSGSMSFQPTYSPTTNRMTLLPGGFVPSYDANGNVLNDSFHQSTWDAEGRPVNMDTVGLTFDALGRMVEQSAGGTYTEIVYAPTGSKLALMNGQTLQKAFVPLPAGATAVYNSSGLAYYRHADWLGSSRFASTPARAMYSSLAYAPFGEPYAQAGTTDPSFTGQNQDTIGGSYDFFFREYAIQGRWPSPDPAGLALASLGNPQSLNRYAYVLNSPLDSVDPLGLCRPDDCELRHPIDAVGSWKCDTTNTTCNTSCYVNGFLSSCGWAFGLLNAGLAVQCPNNFCSGFVTDSNGQSEWVQFRCGGTACGYQTFTQMVANNYECGGRFCSAVGYAQWAIQQNPAAAASQLQAAAQKLADLLHISVDKAKAILQGGQPELQGGNIDFSIDQGTFASGTAVCSGRRCENGLHFTSVDGGFYVHLDSANPFSSLGGFFAHTGIDVLLGNLWYLIIPRLGH